MLADLSITGYIASNIVKDSTKATSPCIFSPPRNKVVLRCLLGQNTEGVGRGYLLVEPVVNETFWFGETKTNRFIHRGNR
jgi:hypothetical protein